MTTNPRPMSKPPVSLNPDSFLTEMASVAKMSMEAAYEWGKVKNQFEDEWARYTIHVQLPGLLGTLEEAASHSGASLSGFTKAISWHWLAKCQTDPVVAAPAKLYAKVRSKVVASVHTDLDFKIKSADRYCFSEVEHLTDRGWLYLPAEVAAALAKYASGAGIPPTDFFLIGLGWSLSTSRRVSLQTRAAKFYLPEYNKLIGLLNSREGQFVEALLVLAYRELRNSGKLDRLFLNDWDILNGDHGLNSPDPESDFAAE